MEEKETLVGPRPRHRRQLRHLELPVLTPLPSFPPVREALRWWDWDKDKNGRQTLPESFNTIAFQVCDRLSAEMETSAQLHLLRATHCGAASYED